MRRRCARMLPDIMSHAFPGEAQLRVFLKYSTRSAGCTEHCRTKRYPRISRLHKNLQDAEFRWHLQRFAATLDCFASIEDEVINYSTGEAAFRGSAPMDVDQVNLIKGNGKGK